MGDTKTCTNCRLTLPLTQYHADLSKRDGLKSACRACQAAKHRISYQRNKRPRDRTPKPAEPVYPLPTMTLTESLDCITLRKWRGEPTGEPLRCRL